VNGIRSNTDKQVAFNNKQDKLDFLAAVTSFANSVGGDLLIGVAAANGVPTNALGWGAIIVGHCLDR
jgi:hypothetical protein